MASFEEWSARYIGNMKTLQDTLKYRVEWLDKFNVAIGEKQSKVQSILDGSVQNGDPSAQPGGDATYNASGMDPEKLKDMPLKGSSGLTAEQIDAWINSKAPKSSIMIGLGSAFIEAEKLSGNRADAILAHAAHESGWGTSNIVRSKFNWYGIGAFDSSPYASAHSFTGAAGGIVNGAAWIAQHYTNSNYKQDTYRKMRFNNGSHQYATDPDWDIKICKIWATAPASQISNDNGAGTNADVDDMNKSGFYQIKGGKVVPPSGSRGTYNSTLANKVHSSLGAGLADLASDKFSKGLGECTMKVHSNYLPGVLLIYNGMKKQGLLTNGKMIVNSAYRVKNPDGPGLDPGAHGWGGAIDIGTHGKADALKIADVCWGIGFRAVSIGGSLNAGRGFVHVDCGPPGSWGYGYGTYKGPGSIK